MSCSTFRHFLSLGAGSPCPRRYGTHGGFRIQLVKFRRNQWVTEISTTWPLMSLGMRRRDWSLDAVEQLPCARGDLARVPRADDSRNQLAVGSDEQRRRYRLDAHAVDQPLVGQRDRIVDPELLDKRRDRLGARRPGSGRTRRRLSPGRATCCTSCRARPVPESACGTARTTSPRSRRSPDGRGNCSGRYSCRQGRAR